MATPRQRQLRHHTLLRALEIAGNERTLARALHVPVADLKAWLEGNETTPTGVFLSAVDVVDEALVEGNQAALDREAHQARHVPNP